MVDVIFNRDDVLEKQRREIRKKLKPYLDEIFLYRGVEENPSLFKRIMEAMVDRAVQTNQNVDELSIARIIERALLLLTVNFVNVDYVRDILGNTGYQDIVNEMSLAEAENKILLLRKRLTEMQQALDNAEKNYYLLATNSQKNNSRSRQEDIETINDLRRQITELQEKLDARTVDTHISADVNPLEEEVLSIGQEFKFNFSPSLLRINRFANTLLEVYIYSEKGRYAEKLRQLTIDGEFELVKLYFLLQDIPDLKLVSKIIKKPYPNTCKLVAKLRYALLGNESEDRLPLRLWVELSELGKLCELNDIDRRILQTIQQLINQNNRVTLKSISEYSKISYPYVFSRIKFIRSILCDGKEVELIELPQLVYGSLES